jgi:hypothetical protein
MRGSKGEKPQKFHLRIPSFLPAPPPANSRAFPSSRVSGIDYLAGTWTISRRPTTLPIAKEEIEKLNHEIFLAGSITTFWSLREKMESEARENSIWQSSS